MKRLFVYIFVLLIFRNTPGQNSIEYFPADLLIKPFTANTLKPKLGFEFKNSVNEISLNIGNSMDILHYRIGKKEIVSFGADLFTYTLLRSQSNFHFPVDAVDYLFGVNVGYAKENYGARLRISHISAHFVDGHYSKEDQAWLNGREPKVYSREFLELIPYYNINDFRIYAGITYIFSIDPRDIGTDQYQLGIEYFANYLINDFVTPYFAYDIRLINLYNYSGNNSLEAGVKFGHSNDRGFSIYFKYFSGYNIHGEYFDIKEDYSAIGFNLDL